MIDEQLVSELLHFKGCPFTGASYETGRYEIDTVEVKGRGFTPVALYRRCRCVQCGGQIEAPLKVEVYNHGESIEGDPVGEGDLSAERGGRRSRNGVG